jgi:two-component system, OmpR family, response regulator VicR
MQKILVIDDEKDMLFMIQHILQSKGFKVEVDDSGNVFEILKHGSCPDLILLDINIGEKNGADICSGLKADEQTRNIPIILVSAERDLLHIKDECGAEDYLSKPFSSKDLLSKVTSYLRAA